MKKTKNVVLKLVAVMLIAIATFSFTACSGYVSRYSAVALITKNTREEGFIKFGSLDGTYVFKLRPDDGAISYEATFGSGSLKVYYDAGEGKTELFPITAGESLSGQAEIATKGKTVYVIIETDGKCTDGEFTFRV